MTNEFDPYVDKSRLGTASDEQLHRDMAILFRMPQQFRLLARDLLRALVRHPKAMFIVSEILIAFAKESLERQGDSAPKLH